MSQHDDIDDARAALIDQRIGQLFDFLGDVIDDPLLLDAIPSGSTLAFRDVEIRGFRFRLTAYQAPGARDQWSALVTGYTKAGFGNEPETQPVENHTNPPPVTRLPGVQTGKTAKSAMDALEGELRGLVTIPA